MKAIKLLFAVLFACAIFENADAQSDKSARTIGIKTATIKVHGVCDMDKRRIETAANTVAGVKDAVWNEYTEVLTLQYSVFTKDAPDKVQKKIASVGNDTEKYKADDAVYNKLPGCCHYQRKQS